MSDHEKKLISSAPKEPMVDSTLSKGLFILETWAQSRQGVGVTELSKTLCLTKSNTFRLLDNSGESHLEY